MICRQDAWCKCVDCKRIDKQSLRIVSWLLAGILFGAAIHWFLN